MPWLPTIQHLAISNCNESIFSCIGGLTSLSVLKVQEVGMCTSLPIGCLRNLTSLTELQIIELRQLQSLPGDEMQHLKMLRSLTIQMCDNLESFLSEVGRLSSLCFLELSDCRRIKLQPEELVCILNSVDKSIRKLSICCCNELESLMTAAPVTSVLQQLKIRCNILPDWLQHLKYLRLLSIEDCPWLQKVPEVLKNLHMLEKLWIVHCPQLKRRCKRETGEDWSIIAHVPHVYYMEEAPIQLEMARKVNKKTILAE
ncbi:uncharacterized protein LOC141816322 [Curcuma longa]|uniref:uncharacterized protein LOC141816322 n=1 Tax=Curcuma longa TaxID=136217 RepID=UPI003D9F8079